MRREHAWVRLGLSWICVPAFPYYLSLADIRKVLEPCLEQSEKRCKKITGIKREEKWKFSTGVDEIGFGWRMTCQMMKRIDTFVFSLGIYMWVILR